MDIKNKFLLAEYWKRSGENTMRLSSKKAKRHATFLKRQRKRALNRIRLEKLNSSDLIEETAKLLGIKLQ